MLTFPFNNDVKFTVLPKHKGVKIPQPDMDGLTVKIENLNRKVSFEPVWKWNDVGIEIEIQREDIPLATTYNVTLDWRKPDGSFHDGYQDLFGKETIQYVLDACHNDCGFVAMEMYPDFKGDQGVGVPKGGAPGQALVKKTNEDYDTEWKTLSTGTGTGDGNDGKTPVIGSITAESIPSTEAPSFSLTHTSNDGDGNPVYTGTIKIPRGKDGVDGDDGNDGDDGIDGKTPVFEIGTVETLSAGSQATASIVPDGETTEGNPKYKVSFGIPKGANGTGEGGGTTNPEWTDIEGKPSWIGVTKPTYTASEIGALPTSHNSDTEAHGGIATKVTTLEEKVQNLESGGSGTIVYEDVEPGEFFGTSDAIPTPVASISITPSTFKLNIGAKQTLVATVLPLNASNKKVNWTTSNPLVATVSNGVVTAIAEGNVTISALATDGSGVVADASGTVEQAEQGAKLITNISLNKVYLQLEAGNTEQLTANITPPDADNKVLVWSSSNPAVATVEDGLVTAVADGSATITATSTDGSGKSGSCNLVVQAAASASSLIADYDFSLYPDGYQGEIEDLSGHGNTPTVIGLNNYITGRDGILNGRFWIQSAGSGRTDTDISFTVPSDIEDTSTLTIEMYAHIRRRYANVDIGSGNYFSTIGVPGTNTFIIFDVASASARLSLLQNQMTLHGSSGVPPTSSGVIDPEIKIYGFDDDTIDSDDVHHIVLSLSPTKHVGYLDGVKIVETPTGKSISYADKVIKFFNNDAFGEILCIKIHNSTLTDAQVMDSYQETVNKYK